MGSSGINAGYMGIILSNTISNIIPRGVSCII